MNHDDHTKRPDRQDDDLSRSEMLDILEPWVTECPECGGELETVREKSGMHFLRCCSCGRRVRW